MACTLEPARAAADPSRCKVLKLLQVCVAGRRGAGRVIRHHQGSLSHHFNVLKAAELIRCERRGQQLVYSLNTTVFQDAAALCSTCSRSTTERRRPMEPSRKPSRANLLNLALLVGSFAAMRGVVQWNERAEAPFEDAHPDAP